MWLNRAWTPGNTAASPQQSLCCSPSTVEAPQIATVEIRTALL